MIDRMVEFTWQFYVLVLTTISTLLSIVSCTIFRFPNFKTYSYALDPSLENSSVDLNSAFKAYLPFAYNKEYHVWNKDSESSTPEQGLYTLFLVSSDDSTGGSVDVSNNPKNPIPIQKTKVDIVLEEDSHIVYNIENKKYCLSKDNTCIIFDDISINPFISKSANSTTRNDMLIPYS